MIIRQLRDKSTIEYTAFFVEFLEMTEIIR